MRVGLDVTPIVVATTGVARYAESVLAELPQRPGVDVVPFALGRGRRPPPNVKYAPIPLRFAHGVWTAIRRPCAESFIGRVDVLHSIDLVPPPTRARLVMTVHDVACVTRPELHPHRAIRLQRMQLKACDAADIVFATCNATANEIQEITGLPRERIVVARLGARAPSDACPRRTLAEPYILAVGAICPRKGFEILAAAVARLPPGSPRLVIAGPDGWMAADVKRKIVEACPPDRFRLLGKVSDQVLESLYRHAAVVCQSSHAEGFGMPTLEAMAYGVPIVATDLPATREITEGSAVLVPSGDADALSDALEGVLRGEGRRREMASRARVVAAKYTWSAMVDALVTGYRMALL